MCEAVYRSPTFFLGGCKQKVLRTLLRTTYSNLENYKDHQFSLIKPHNVP